MTIAIAHLRVTAEQARRRALDWLRAEHGVAPDILDATAYLVPLLDVACDWRAEWRGFVGTPDAAAHAGALDRHRAALAAEPSPRHAPPAEPRAADHVSWRPAEGALDGTGEWSSVFDGELPASGLPPAFREWCTRLGRGTPSGPGDETTDLAAWKAAAAAPAVMLRAHDPHTIFRRLHEEVEARIRDALAAVLPEHHRRVSYVHRDAGDGERWTIRRTRLLPVWLLRYRRAGVVAHVAVDGVHGAACAGDAPPEVAAPDLSRRAAAAWLAACGAVVLAAVLAWLGPGSPASAPPERDRAETAALSQGLDAARSAVPDAELRDTALRMASRMCLAAVAGASLGREAGDAVLRQDFPRLAATFASCLPCNADIARAAAAATLRVFNLHARQGAPTAEGALTAIGQSCRRELAGWDPVIR